MDEVQEKCWTLRQDAYTKNKDKKEVFHNFPSLQ